MTYKSMVTRNEANSLAPRILARQLARPLSDDEIDFVAGGMIAREIGGTSLSVAPRADTNTCSGCPVNDCDA